MQEKKSNYSKLSLEKALRARLAALTQGLADAEVGGKGIDVVKEIKELDAMIASLKPESKAKKQEEAKIELAWADAEQTKQDAK